MVLQEMVMNESDRDNPRSSAALVETTGRDRAEWFDVLDQWGAAGRPYRDIANWLKSEHGLSNWWAQKLIVEYEEARGIRDPGVRRDGTFEVGASKTVSVRAETVIEAFASAAVRQRWLPHVQLGEVTRSEDRLRFDWPTDGSRVTVSLSGTPGGKTTVVVQHDRLEDAKVAQETKTFWRDRLTDLKRLLEA